MLSHAGRREKGNRNDGPPHLSTTTRCVADQLSPRALGPGPSCGVRRYSSLPLGVVELRVQARSEDVEKPRQLEDHRHGGTSDPSFPVREGRQANAKPLGQLTLRQPEPQPVAADFVVDFRADPAKAGGVLGLHTQTG